MPLTGKYLKYFPEITLEIFTLIWNKLSEIYKPHSNGVWVEYTQAFKNNGGFLRTVNNNDSFGVYYYNINLIETTAQEILGYDPFVKDDFVLPDKWKVKINNSNRDIISKYLKTLPYVKLGYDIRGFLVSDPRDGSYLHYGDSLSYTEITFEQFQKYVLKTTEQPKVMEKSYNTIGKEELLDWSKATEKELLAEAKRRYPIGTVFSPAHINSKCRCIVTNFNFVTTKRQSKTIGVAILTDDKKYYSDDIKYGDTAYDRLVYSDGKWAEIISLPETKVESKEVIPEYVECIEGYSDQFTKGKIYKISTTFISDQQYHTEIDDRGLPNGWSKNKFKPSTKEAFEAQNKPKPIAKWSVGSYVVFLQDEILTRSGRVTKGKPYVLTESGRCPYFKDDNINQINFDSSASESYGLKWFATLYEAEEFAKTLVKPFKQAVHCKTQEEWDFVLSKFNPKNLTNDKFSSYPDIIIIISDEIDKSNVGCYGSVSCQKDSYQILSFQEWCDLHGYKMEKEVKFEVGDWVIITKSNLNWNDCMDYYVGKVVKITSISSSTSIEFEDRKHWSFLATNGHFRHATPIEINNHLISIGQITRGEPLNTGIEPNKDGTFKYATVNDNSFNDKCSTSVTRAVEIIKHKMTLSIDDEELPMVSIIKTNTIKKLLNNN